LLSCSAITIGDLNYDTDDTRDDISLFDNDLDSYFEKSAEERATDVSDATDDSDAYVCEVLDEPNYISADHDYYPDLSEWQSDVETPSTGEDGSDERSTSTLEHYFSSLISFDRGEAEVRMAATMARCKALDDVLGDDSDESDE
jgi:hypothetical protein